MAETIELGEATLSRLEKIFGQAIYNNAPDRSEIDVTISGADAGGEFMLKSIIKSALSEYESERR